MWGQARAKTSRYHACTIQMEVSKVRLPLEKSHQLLTNVGLAQVNNCCITGILGEGKYGDGKIGEYAKFNYWRKLIKLATSMIESSDSMDMLKWAHKVSHTLKQRFKKFTFLIMLF